MPASHRVKEYNKCNVKDACSYPGALITDVLVSTARCSGSWRVTIARAPVQNECYCGSPNDIFTCANVINCPSAMPGCAAAVASLRSCQHVIFEEYGYPEIEAFLIGTHA